MEPRLHAFPALSIAQQQGWAHRLRSGVRVLISVASVVKASDDTRLRSYCETYCSLMDKCEPQRSPCDEPMRATCARIRMRRDQVTFSRQVRSCESSL